MTRNDFGFGLKSVRMKPFKIKSIRSSKPIKLTSFGKTPGRESLPAKKKNAIRERARNTCEYPKCHQRENLQFHHKNQKNTDDRLSNIELLCPNHHAKRHNQKFRKIIRKDPILGIKKTRLTKKTKGKNKKIIKRDIFGIPINKQHQISWRI